MLLKGNSTILDNAKQRGAIMIQVYCYSKCSTCQKALKYLKTNSIPHEVIDIQGDHPDREILENLYKRSGLPLKKFFNTSGLLYKSMELSKKPNYTSK